MTVPIVWNRLRGALRFSWPGACVLSEHARSGFYKHGGGECYAYPTVLCLMTYNLYDTVPDIETGYFMVNKTKQNKLRGFSPQAMFTD
jgi:hypothetical protein